MTEKIEQVSFAVGLATIENVSVFSAHHSDVGDKLWDLEKGKYKIVTIKNVHDGKFVMNFDSFIDELPKKMAEPCPFQKGDILL